MASFIWMGGRSYAGRCACTHHNRSRIPIISDEYAATDNQLYQRQLYASASQWIDDWGENCYCSVCSFIDSWPGGRSVSMLS
ncbi:hypothetical protein IF2G_07757 [Cordyceps javanica]|nr:hypothetical protein IF2G_07757 [Cordyceps javanica]